jgi:hypothetical protein
MKDPTGMASAAENRNHGIEPKAASSVPEDWIGREFAAMYLRRHRRTVDGTPYEYWTLVESRRTASGPRQHTVVGLGKSPTLDPSIQAGWQCIDDLLEGRPPTQQRELSGPPARRLLCGVKSTCEANEKPVY